MCNYEEGQGLGPSPSEILNIILKEQSVTVVFYVFVTPRDFVSTSGLAVSAKQARKKWTNLKAKYKVISTLYYD